MRNISLDSSRITECAICGNELAAGQKVVCSNECYRQLRTTRYLGRMDDLDAAKAQAARRTRVKEITRYNTHLGRTCPTCGQRHVSSKFDLCENCRYEDEQEQKLRNKELIQSHKRPPTLEYLSKSRLAALGITHWTELTMQELYNCKSVDATHYRITKFDKHLNPKYGPTGQSSYTVSTDGCDCPQGHSKSCRHRKMLPFFTQHDYVDSGYFFVWDTHQWYKPTGIFAEARSANGKVADDPLLSERTPGALFRLDEGGTPVQAEEVPASEVPSPQPSPKPAYRRF